MKDALIRVLKGIAFGVANIIPGVSGGTIAVILKFFDGLIEAINTLFSNFKKNILYLLPLGIGAALGIVGFSKLLRPALDYYPFQTNMFFVGLIAGSIPLLWGLARKKKFHWTHVIPCLVALAVIVVLAVIQKPITMEEIKVLQGASAEIVASTITAPDSIGRYLYLIVCGAIASAAMVVPGISGSFMMVLLGEYNTVLNSVDGLTSMDTIGASILNLIPVAIGIVIGVVGIAKLIDFLLKRFYSYSYSAILGLVGGSIFTILYSPETYYTVTGAPITWSVWGIIIAVAVFALGFVLAFFLGKDKTEEKK